MVVRFGTVGLVVRFRLLGVVRVCVLCRRGRDEGEQSNGAVVWPHRYVSARAHARIPVGAAWS